QGRWSFLWSVRESRSGRCWPLLWRGAPGRGRLARPAHVPTAPGPAAAAAARAAPDKPRRQCVLHVGELRRTRVDDEAPLALPFRDRRQLAAGPLQAAAVAHHGRQGVVTAAQQDTHQAQHGPTRQPCRDDRAAPLEIAEPVLDTLVVVALQRLADGLDFGV